MTPRVLVLNGWAAAPEAWSLCRFPRERIFSYRDHLDGATGRAFEATGRAVLVGWSMGATHALRLALRDPGRVAGLVLVAATPRMMADEGWRGMTERRLAALEAGLRLTMGGGLFGVPAGRPNPYMMDDEATLARGLAYLRETDLRSELERRRGELRGFPVRLFQSVRDGIVRPENAAYLKTIFPDAVLEMVTGAEHALPVAIPARLDAAVEEVLGSRG